jgi:hypothetical protein
MMTDDDAYEAYRDAGGTRPRPDNGDQKFNQDNAAREHWTVKVERALWWDATLGHKIGGTR